MQGRKLVWVGLAILALFLPVIPVLSQPEPPSFMDEAFNSPQRPGALFDHDAHTEYDVARECYVCHHLYEDGKLVPEESSEDAKCAECHQLDPEGPAPGLMQAYHKRCKGCHEKQEKGPITCGECHKRDVSSK